MVGRPHSYIEQGGVEKAAARANAQRYAVEIGDILASCPRELLLMLKARVGVRGTIVGVGVGVVFWEFVGSLSFCAPWRAYLTRPSLVCCRE